MKTRILIISLILALNAFSSHSQTLSQAKAWYLSNQHQKALPVFKKQLLLKPKDPSLNLWYGACLIETGKHKDALPYLMLAKEKSIMDAFLYLAKYHFKSNTPDSAAAYIQEYLELNPRNDEGKAAAIELQKKIEVTLDQFRKVEDITFIDSVIVIKSNLYQSLKVSKDAGNIFPVKTYFPDAVKALGSAYIPEKEDRAIYADAVPDKALDLVVRHKLLNEWDGIEPLSDIINTPADEANPWLLADGTTLYFASNRAGGYGGYDLYVTRMGNNDTYLLPDHLNMPFNSPGNDYFLILDEFSNRGYLATDRNQPRGYVIIYTFIPNPTTVLVEGKSIKELQDLAAIKSIRDTWKGKNMDSLLLQEPKTPRIKRDNTLGEAFMLNDQIKCYSPEDFISSQAAQKFVTYTIARKTQSEQILKLQQLRDQYLSASKAGQSTLYDQIMLLEKQVLKSKQQLPVLENEIRMLELNTRMK